MMDKAGRGEFTRGWRVLLAALLGTMCGASPLPYNTIGSFLQPLGQEFGWNAGAIMTAVMCFGLSGCLCAPVVGALADRYGARVVGLLSLVAFAVVFAALGLTGSLAMFYAGYLLIGVVGIGSTPITWSRAVNLWFVRRRGMALGIMLTGTGLAAFFLPTTAVFLIQHWGWRWAYAALALLPVVVALPVVWSFMREPAAGQVPALAGGGASIDRTGVTLVEAMRDRRFWIMMLAFLVISIAYGGFHTNLQNMARLKGLSRETGALIAGCVGLAIIVGRVGAGMLVDRIWAPVAAFPLLAMPALGCVIFISDTTSTGLIVLAAILLGGAAGAEADMISYLAGRYFGMAFYGRIYGMLYAAFGCGAAISAPIYGYVFSATGSYVPILAAAAVMFLGGAALLLLLGPYPVSLPAIRPAQPVPVHGS
ncbi:MFS transporter [Nitrospirillum sp. BR 11828]|uniref:MFS transporter n=1 Tax=Nitrospirillum sp. BR 11828 TaxID=3104325 RepID=UPI002ACA89FE|nr:MFS transporter [Nitrospirillum sp. BR 11828]MDZ5650034.1 MFS transporter [Nitrospirillum sp. BR 11828]